MSFLKVGIIQLHASEVVAMLLECSLSVVELLDGVQSNLVKLLNDNFAKLFQS